MLLYIFLLLIALLSLLTLQNWRRGIYFMILLAAIQDPVRKMVPGAPGYLVLSIAPIWFAMILRAFNLFGPGWAMFKKAYRQLSKYVIYFILSLIPAALISATYGPGSWKITLIGLFSYTSLLFGVLIGYIFPRGEKDLENVIVFFTAITAIMLFGTPLEYLEMGKGWLAIGTSALGQYWINTAIYGHVVEMIAGFYRSPDVMGWHATIMVMFAAILALGSRGPKRYFWITMAAWGLVSVMLCGRRKMLYMLPIFVFIVAVFSWQFNKNKKQFRQIILIGIATIIAGYSFYEIVGPSKETELFYFNNPQSVMIRIKKHGLEALLGTYSQSGFFGEGLGTASQGKQHVDAVAPRTWQEGGLSRLFVELGGIGLVCFIMMVYAVIKSILWLLKDRHYSDSRSRTFRIGFAAIICANLGSFVISHQIFGDPFVNIFFAFLTGLILSGARSDSRLVSTRSTRVTINADMASEQLRHG